MSATTNSSGLYAVRSDTSPLLDDHSHRYPNCCHWQYFLVTVFRADDRGRMENGYLHPLFVAITIPTGHADLDVLQDDIIDQVYPPYSSNKIKDRTLFRAQTLT